MKSNNNVLTRSLLYVSISVLVSLPIASTALANEHETQCFNDVQGKIPWEENNLNWDPENVKQLCEGTTAPSEPGKCFLSVKSGQVNWGKGSNWEWKNIINLCAGSNDAAKTVECFNKGITAGSDWRDAILICQRSLNSKK